MHTGNVMNYSFSCAGKCFFTLSTDAKIDDEDLFLQKLGAFIPSLRRIENPKQTDFILYLHTTEEKPVFRDAHPTYVYERSPRDQSLPEDIFHLLYGLVRKQLIENHQIFCVHSACLSYCDQNLLFVGHSGSGKTTLAQLMIDHHDAKLISGNKTLIEIAPQGLIIHGGTHTMTALDKNLNRYAYALPSNKYHTGHKERVDYIFLPRLNDGVCENIVLQDPSKLHTLYPYFLDSVNSDIIVNGAYVFNGDVEISIKKHLIAGLASCLKNISVRAVKGTSGHLLEVITSHKTPQQKGISCV